MFTTTLYFQTHLLNVHICTYKKKGMLHKTYLCLKQISIHGECGAFLSFPVFLCVTVCQQQNTGEVRLSSCLSLVITP